MKFYESKTAKFLAGKGFYFVLALCMVIIGVAAYSAMEAQSPEITDKGDSSIDYNIDSSIYTPPAYDESEMTASDKNDESTKAIEAENESSEEPYFIIPINGTVTKPFSDSALLYSETFKDMRIHNGADITPNNATVVVSAYSGEVLKVEDSAVQGTVITVDHGNGIVLKYCGVKNVTVQEGDIVSAEEILAEIDTVLNECADPPHLHLELLIDGEYADPMTLFAE